MLVIGACGGDGPRKLGDGETLRVMASTPHLASLAMAIAGDKAEITTLAPEGVNPHEYEPTVADRRRLQEAHLLLINGLKLEAWDAAEIAKPARTTLVDCSAAIPEDWLLGSEEDGHAHDHDHDHGEHNPHVWLSTEGAIHQAEAITEAMAKIDAANAEAYRENLAKLKDRLVALRDEFKPKIANLTKRKFISNHDAFPYFAREFGLEQVGVIQLTPGHEPTVQQRRDIELKLATGEADAIFMEPGFSDSAAKAIADTSEVPLAALDPFGVGKPGPDALEKILRANLETVLEILG